MSWNHRLRVIGCTAFLISGCCEPLSAPTNPGIFVQSEPMPLRVQPPELTEEQKLEQARFRLHELHGAVREYFIRYDSFPETLEILLHPHAGPPLLTSIDQLIDPWHQPYRYRVDVHEAGNLVPAIWTVSPEQIPVGDAPP